MIGSRWYWDKQNNPARSSILVFSDGENGNVVRVSLKLQPENTVYISTADIINKDNEKDKNYIKMK